MKSSKNTTEEGSNPYKMGIFQPGEQKNGTLSKFDGLEQLSRDELIERGESDKDVALRIVTDPKFKSKWDCYTLSFLGEAHIEVAYHILTSPELLKIGGRFLLSSIAKTHEEIAKFIIKDKELFKIYSDDDNLLAGLGATHVSIARMIIKRPDICTRGLLEYIGQKHEEIAVKILSNEKLAERCSPPGFTEMAEIYPKAAEILFSKYSRDWLASHWGEGAVGQLYGYHEKEGGTIFKQLYEKVCASDITVDAPSPKL